MGATTGGNVAALTGQLQQGLAALSSMGMNLNGAAGGGGTATTPGAVPGAPAPGTGAPGAGGVPGAAASNLPPGPVGTFQTASGKAVAVSRDQQGKLAIARTGSPEVVSIPGPGGGTKYFDANGAETTAFQFTEGHTFKINLDYREGIATGLANLSRIFGARQERVRLLSNALANDANATGSFNPVDLQKMSLETTTTQQLSEMQKKIFDSMRDSIQAWLR